MATETRSLFQDATNHMAYLKAGFMGFAGSGKTYTASRLALGLVAHMKQLKLPAGERPVYFLDTETGADWLIPQFVKEGVALRTAKTRSFADLMTATHDAEQHAAILIIDSITHIWRELCESYMKKKNRTRLQFEDWAVLKKEWGGFTDLYINSAAHIIICGRAGYEYDYFEDEAGKKQLEKTGIKMKAESEMGFEPSLLVLMEREVDPDTKVVSRTAYILKDRSTMLDGKSFTNPTFQSFLPHIETINLGGTQVGVETGRTSEALFDAEGNSGWKIEQQQKSVALEEIQNELVKGIPGSSALDKVTRILLLEDVFKTNSWTKIETMKANQLIDGLSLIRDILSDSDQMIALREEAGTKKLREGSNA